MATQLERRSFLGATIGLVFMAVATDAIAIFQKNLKWEMDRLGLPHRGSALYEALVANNLPKEISLPTCDRYFTKGNNRSAPNKSQQLDALAKVFGYHGKLEVDSVLSSRHITIRKRQLGNEGEIHTPIEACQRILNGPLRDAFLVVIRQFDSDQVGLS